LPLIRPSFILVISTTELNCIDTVRTMAVANRILAQAEEEGKAYVITLLRELGHADIEVLFADQKPEATGVKPTQTFRNLAAKVEATPFGFIPLR